MTDRAKNYTDDKDFLGALEEIGARHKLIGSYRPQTNGKADGLVCALQGCATILSTYNRGATCWLHSERLRPLLRG